MIPFSVSLSTNKNAFNASFVVDGARLPAPITPSIFVICRFLTFWTLPTSLWASPCFDNVKEPLWDHLWPLPCAALSHFFANIASYVPSPLSRGATLLVWPFGHATSTTSSSLDLQTCSILTPSRPSLSPSSTLLGFVLSTSQRTITFRQPPHLTLIRSNRTAGSPDMALTGFFTRGILICRLTRPRDLIFPQLIDLTQRYLDKDFTMTQLLPFLHQLCHRFHLPRPPLHAQCRFLTFSPDAAHGTDLRIKITLVLTSRLSFSLIASLLLLGYLFTSMTSFHSYSLHQRLGSNTLFYIAISKMSHPTTSDLISTIATQLNIVIVALRLLVDMIQNPDEASPLVMTPGSCPPGPPASPTSPLFRTIPLSVGHLVNTQHLPQIFNYIHRRLTIWLHHRRLRHRLGHTLPLPSPSPCPLPPSPSSSPPPVHPPSLPLPLPRPLLLPHFPFLLPLHAYMLPSACALPPSPSPSGSLVSSAPRAPLPPVSANDVHPPHPFFSLLLFPPPLAPSLTPLGMMIGAPKMMTFFSASNAMNDFDPVGATSPAKCSAPNLRFALVGLNFLNYSDLPLHDFCLRFTLSPTHPPYRRRKKDLPDLRGFSLMLPSRTAFLSPLFRSHLIFIPCYISLSAQTSVSLFFVRTFDAPHVHFTRYRYQTTSPFCGLSPSGPRRICSRFHYLPEESSSDTAPYFTADDVYLSGSFERSRAHYGTIIFE